MPVSKGFESNPWLRYAAAPLTWEHSSQWVLTPTFTRKQDEQEVLSHPFCRREGGLCTASTISSGDFSGGNAFCSMVCGRPLSVHLLLLAC